VRETGEPRVEEVVADKGYHSGSVLSELHREEMPELHPGTRARRAEVTRKSVFPAHIAVSREFFSAITTIRIMRHRDECERARELDQLGDLVDEFTPLVAHHQMNVSLAALLYTDHTFSMHP
jgi:hypothetical protein